MAYVCVKTEKRNHFIAFHGSFIPKRWKNSQNLEEKKKPFVLWLPGQCRCRNNINYDIK